MIILPQLVSASLYCDCACVSVGATRFQDKMKNDSILLFKLIFFRFLSRYCCIIACWLPMNCAHVKPLYYTENWSHSDCSPSAKYIAMQYSMCAHGIGNYMYGSFGTPFVTQWLICNVTCSPCVFNNWWGLYYCHTYSATCIIRLASDWDVSLCWFLHGLTLLFSKSVWTVMKQSYDRACDASLQ